MKNFNTSLLSAIIFIPAFNFAQLASNLDMDDTDYSTELSSGTANVSAINFSELFNATSIIKSYMKPVKLEGGVNSQYPELGGLVSPDGKTLYFSRYRDPKNIAGIKDDEDIWYSEWNETTNSWGEAKNIGAPLNNKYPNYINSISPDGNTLLLGNAYLTNGKMSNGLSLSKRTADGWSFPEEIKIDGTNRNTNWAGSNLSNSQKVLLLAYEQNKNTIGQRDLYVSFVKADNTWTKPINLGTTINTKGTESSPFLAADDSTLYYTTDGLNGYGGSDIYVTRRLDDTWQNWTTPRNLGPIVNTDSHQSFFSISNGNIYFSSETETSGDLDLYMLTLPGSSSENPNDQKIHATTFASVFEESKSSATTDELNKTTATTNKTNLVLSTVYFDFNKADLNKTTIYELNRIATILKDAPGLQLEVSGHTDNIGSSRYNTYLSQKRTDAILFYLKHQADINEKRIVVKNYGETKPVTSNDTKEGRKLNRRVEMTLKKTLVD